MGEYCRAQSKAHNFLYQELHLEKKKPICAFASGWQEEHMVVLYVNSYSGTFQLNDK